MRFLLLLWLYLQFGNHSRIKWFIFLTLTKPVTKCAFKCTLTNAVPNFWWIFKKHMVHICIKTLLMFLKIAVFQELWNKKKSKLISFILSEQMLHSVPHHITYNNISDQITNACINVNFQEDWGMSKMQGLSETAHFSPDVKWWFSRTISSWTSWLSLLQAQKNYTSSNSIGFGQTWQHPEHNQLCKMY